MKGMEKVKKSNRGQECRVGCDYLDLRVTQSPSESLGVVMAEAFVKNADPWLLPTAWNSLGGVGGEAGIYIFISFPHEFDTPELENHDPKSCSVCLSSFSFWKSFRA